MKYRHVHMNGRVYDYNIGRFTSVDPFIQGDGSQAMNPYSYIQNNPLAGTDPSGYSIRASIDCIADRGSCGAALASGGKNIGGAAGHNGNENNTQSYTFGATNDLTEIGDVEPINDNNEPRLELRSVSNEELTEIYAELDRVERQANIQMMREAGQKAIGVGAQLVPGGDAALKAVKGDTEGAIQSGLTEVAMIAATAGVGYLGYKIIKAVEVAKSTKGLGNNPFKNKSPQDIDKMFNDKGFDSIGPDPKNGRGSYINTNTGRKYYIDKGKGGYRNGMKENPHVDVHRMRDGKNVEGEKRKYPLGEKLYEKE